MSLQQSAPDDDGLDELLAEDAPRLAPRPLAGAGLPSHRLMLTGLVLEPLSPVAVVAVKTDAAAFIAAARGNGLIVLPAGDNVVRLLPPLTLSEAEAREGLELLNKTASQVEAQKAAAQ